MGAGSGGVGVAVETISSGKLKSVGRGGVAVALGGGDGCWWWGGGGGVCVGGWGLEGRGSCSPVLCTLHI